MSNELATNRSPGSLVGYARTSTHDQTAGMEAQERELTTAGCIRIFREQVSSVDVTRREALAEALAWLRPGDTLVVTKLDRLARSVGNRPVGTAVDQAAST